jgi:hypothetical protein
MINKSLQIAWRALFGSKIKRYEARYEILRFICKKFGFRIYNKNLRWQRDMDYLSVWQNFPEGNDYIHDRHYMLYNLVKSLKSIPGDTVECGAYRGASSYLIISARGKQGAYHHIFDSFAGLSELGGHDIPEQMEAQIWLEGDLSAPEKTIRENLSSFDKVKYYKGWIPARFQDVADREFAFVHIDVDLYKPTKDCLEFFYERTKLGGILLCDDYGSETCPGAYKAFNEFVANKTEEVIHLTVGSGFIIKQ